MDEETGTTGAINSTPDAATKIFRCITLIVEPRGTYLSNFPPKMLISSSKEALTSSEAPETASISCVACSSESSDTSKASKISVAWSAVTDWSTSGLVAKAVASSALTPSSIMFSTAACTSDCGNILIAPKRAVTSGSTCGSSGVIGANVVVVGTVVEVVDVEDVVVVVATTTAGTVLVVVGTMEVVVVGARVVEVVVVVVGNTVVLVVVVVVVVVVDVEVVVLVVVVDDVVVVVCSTVVVVCIDPTPLNPSSYCRFQPPPVRQALGSPQQIPALSL